MNKPLSQPYYLKEQLREIWMQPNKQAAEKVMLDWVKQAQESKVHRAARSKTARRISKMLTSKK